MGEGGEHARREVFRRRHHPDRHPPAVGRPHRLERLARILEDRGDSLGAEQALDGFIAELWDDLLGFAGVEIHRRILGLAHNADFEAIEDPDLRANCERPALRFGRQLAVARGRLHWIATPPMRDEFSHVLGRGLAASRGADAAALMEVWDRLARNCPPAAPSALVCNDPDDQMFLDLGLATGGAWLVTRDRALLSLRTRALALGLRILTPGDPGRAAVLTALTTA